MPSCGTQGTCKCNKTNGHDPCPKKSYYPIRKPDQQVICDSLTHAISKDVEGAGIREERVIHRWERNSSGRFHGVPEPLIKPEG